MICLLKAYYLFLIANVVDWQNDNTPVMSGTNRYHTHLQVASKNRTRLEYEKKSKLFAPVIIIQLKLPWAMTHDYRIVKSQILGVLNQNETENDFTNKRNNASSLYWY